MLKTNMQTIGDGYGAEDYKKFAIQALIEGKEPPNLIFDRKREEELEKGGWKKYYLGMGYWGFSPVDIYDDFRVFVYLNSLKK
jgi:hypothetical protein